MDRKKRELSPWQKIMRAAEMGTSLRLRHDEVVKLSKDDAIETRATLDSEGLGRTPGEDPAK